MLPPPLHSDTLFWQHMAKQHKNPYCTPTVARPKTAATPLQKRALVSSHATRGQLNLNYTQR